MPSQRTHDRTFRKLGTLSFKCREFATLPARRTQNVPLCLIPRSARGLPHIGSIHTHTSQQPRIASAQAQAACSTRHAVGALGRRKRQHGAPDTRHRKRVVRARTHKADGARVPSSPRSAPRCHRFILSPSPPPARAPRPASPATPPPPPHLPAQRRTSAARHMSARRAVFAAIGGQIICSDARRGQGCHPPDNRQGAPPPLPAGAPASQGRRAWARSYAGRRNSAHLLVCAGERGWRALRRTSASHVSPRARKPGWSGGGAPSPRAAHAS